MDLLKLEQDVTDHLTETYKHSKAFTQTYLRKMHSMVHEAGATFENFDKALDTYQDRLVIKNKDAGFPPKPAELKPILNQIVGNSKKNTPESPMRRFSVLVERYGWHEGIRMFSINAENKEWLEQNVRPNIIYSGFPDWFQEYLSIFHAGNPIAAQKHLILNTKVKDKSEFQRTLQRYERAGNKAIMRCLPCFRNAV
jgi:hypothetical protein